MSSSLAAQLAQGSSLNSSFLVEKTRRNPTESYLFTGREADRHDLDSIHALASNAFDKFRLLHPEAGQLKNHDALLFSDAAKSTDRTLLSGKASDDLNKALKSFLPLLGHILLEAQAGRMLEWLVRRFRIHQFNVEDVLTLFLPYHDSPHFTKMVSILHIKPNTSWAFLVAYKSAAQSLPRAALVSEMLRSPDVARFIASLLPRACKERWVYHALTAFHTGAILEFLARRKVLEDETVAFLLPAMLTPLDAVGATSETILSSYILLSALSQKSTLTPQGLEIILNAMASASGRVTSPQLLNAVVSVVSPQDVLEYLPSELNQALLSVQQQDHSSLSALSWAGTEKLIMPLATSLVGSLDDKVSSSFFNAIVANPDSLSPVLHHIASLALQGAVAESTPPASFRKLLFDIQQRHPDVLQAASQEMTEADADMHEAVEQLLMSLSVKPALIAAGDNTLDVDVVVASLSANHRLREAAVKKITAILRQSPESTFADDADLEALHSALLARISDSSVAVLEAVYSKPAVLALVAVPCQEGFLSSVIAQLNKDTALRKKRVPAQKHWSFLAHHFTTSSGVSSASLERVAYEAFFQFLLYTKPRKKTANVVWEVLESGETIHPGAGVSRYELMKGCVEAWRWVFAKRSKNRSGNTPEKLAAIEVQLFANLNMAVATRMAENILASNDYSYHIGKLLSKIRGTDAHARGLAFLVIRSLLGLMSGEHQLKAALQVMNGMGVTTLEGMGGFMKGSDSLEEFLSDESLGKNLVTKPKSLNTVHWLQTAVLTMIPVIVKPAGVTLDFMNESIPVSHSYDTRGARYVALKRVVYRLANSSTNLPVISGFLVRALFMNLAEDTLAFLAGIWTSGPSDTRRVALAHAVAFLAAHEGPQNVIDFQTVLPAVLVALTDEDAAIRAQATEVLRWMKILRETGHPTSVYAFDTIYGKNSSQLQYLSWQDSAIYVPALVEMKQHFVSDPGYVRIFHQQHLSPATSDKSKRALYKQRVLCHILSHANACSVPEVRLSLLRMVEDVSDPVKAPIMSTLIQAMVDNARSDESHQTFGARIDEFAALAASAFDASAATELNDASSNLWATYTRALEYFICVGAPGSPSKAREVLFHHLKQGLFIRLAAGRQFQLVEVIVKTGVQETAVRVYCTKVLADLLTGVPLLVRLLNAFAPVGTAEPQHVSKRAKVDAEAEPMWAAHLTLFAESLSAMSLPGSSELIASLLDTLHKVSQFEAVTAADKSYMEQLLMSAVENAASSVSDAATSAPTKIRLEILVDIIRVSENPQTYHQALLLMSNLARLTPQSVLHNIMPVFTFMGSNVFHRDDTYSFRVIQKTIDNIVPVMTSSLKDQHTERFHLQLASRDFLRVFTDAANHVPRHRRTPFFVHLIDVLGPDDFLAIVSILILGKAANRITKQSGEDLRTTLSLPLSLVQHYPARIQVPVLVEHLCEAQRLLSRGLNPQSSHPLLLEGSQDEEQGTRLATILKKRALGLIIFVAFVLDNSTSTLADPTIPKDTLDQLIILLLQIHNTSDAHLDNKDVARIARVAIAQCLKLTPARAFVASAAKMLGGDNTIVQGEALALLAERLPSVSENVRQRASPTIIQIVQAITPLLSSSNVAAAPAFTALKAISISLCPGEEAALVGILPQVLSALHGENQSVAIAVLPPLSAKLGPRIIPFFRSIVQECVSILSGVINTTDGDTASQDALAVLKELFKAIPAFWGTGEIASVFRLHLDYRSSAAGKDVFGPFIRLVASKAQTKVVLTTLSDMWTSMTENDDASRLEGFFDLLKRTLRAAPRPSVLESLHPTFKLLLEGLDLRSRSLVDIDQVERTAIAAFLELVTKLNETAFRPLFRKLFDWAFADASTARTITFCRAYSSLLGYFKALMTPYFSFLMQPFIDLLNGFSADADSDDERLWICVLETLTQGMIVDEGGAYWREDKLERITAPLVAQISNCIDRDAEDNGRDQVVKALAALCDAANDDVLLKKLNLDVLMHTRSEDARVRLFALQCSKALWTGHGDKLIGYVSETITFMAECAEDEHDGVVRATHELKTAVESATGENIDGL
ncbi:hypothetical protein FA95DRAFT_1483564 [Auriscalpium vulgare]|uniref:Uncharacterized protein n=1 Tax=Auriscalpium vulgare TaxID=40419 RepID=A0ACB8S7F6_9AGAM|nr:hypothetical protein FA95DRAFT_1483564 [Auriscalpium vulgare]